MEVQVELAAGKVKRAGLLLVCWVLLVGLTGFFLEIAIDGNFFERSGSVITISVAVFYAYLEQKNNFVGLPAWTIDGTAGLQLRPMAAAFELPCLLIGTIIWGFGSLLMNAYRCGSLECSS